MKQAKGQRTEQRRTRTSIIVINAHRWVDDVENWALRGATPTDDLSIVVVQNSHEFVSVSYDVLFEVRVHSAALY